MNNNAEYPADNETGRSGDLPVCPSSKLGGEKFGW